MKKIIEILAKKGQTLATMESCTGGAFANEITSVEGASDVFCFGAVTYSNDYKIKLGVDKSIIDQYSVYSIDVANAMSRAICEYTGADYGIGITGKLNRIDKNNLYGADNIVYVSIYHKKNHQSISIEVKKSTREENKKLVVEITKKELLKILHEE